MRQVLIPAIFITISVIAIDIGYQFFKAWKQRLLEVEKYKIESAKAQLQNIKNQLNPHFLFNNLSVLSSLVYKIKIKPLILSMNYQKYIVMPLIIDSTNSKVPFRPKNFFASIGK